MTDIEETRPDPRSLFGAALDNLEAGNFAGAERDLRRGIAVMDVRTAPLLARIDAAPAAEPVPLTLDRTLLAKALDNVKRHGGNYVDADHLRWYADAIAKSYETLAALASPDKGEPRP